MEILSLVWNEGIIRPMVNALVILYAFLFQNFGLSIVVFTFVVHMLTLPLTLRQIKQTKAMMDIQPRLQEVRKKHGQDRQRMTQETMRLYREYGVSPVGCLGPLVIQMPILIGLYWALINTLPTSPEQLKGLGEKLYSGINVVHQVVPVNGSFLGMDLAIPASLNPPVISVLLVILVAGSMWVQQKMTTSPSADPTQARQQRMMLWMMPAFFALLAWTLPTGLSFYILISNIFRMITQYFVSGWGSLIPARQPATAALRPSPRPDKEMSPHDGAREPRSSGQDRGRSHRNRPKGARRRSRRGRGRGR